MAESDSVILTRADLKFIVFNTLCAGKERHWWCFRYLRDCIKRGWVTAQEAMEFHRSADCSSNPKDWEKWTAKWREEANAWRRRLEDGGS